MKKINVLDAFFVVFLVGLSLFFVVTNFAPKPKQENVILTGRVTENQADILDEAMSQIGRPVFFNGTKDAVILKSVLQKDGTVFLVLSGPGKVEHNRSIFNGEVVASGQRAEVHSNFQAKLIITSVENE